MRNALLYLHLFKNPLKQDWLLFITSEIFGPQGDRAVISYLFSFMSVGYHTMY